jgi:uncharacterized repeat protein (TIGR02543 family)
MTLVAPFGFRVGYFGLLVALVSVVGISAHSTPAAVATTSPSSLTVYLDAPFVQGSYVAEAGVSDPNVLSMSFNGPTGANQCGVDAPTGITISGQCQMYTAQSHGGATTPATDATPTVRGDGSNFPSTIDSNSKILISLDNDSRYLGFWWPSGSPGNTLKFFNGSTLLLTVTTSDIISLLGTAPANSTAWKTANTDDESNVVRSLNNTLHRKVWYFGNPRGYTTIPPEDWAEAGSRPAGITSWSSSQPFVYVHMFADGNLTFNAVELSGQGFEFDNLAVSTTARTPNESLVRVGEPIVSSQRAVLFEPNGADVQGAMPSQVGTSDAALSTNNFRRSGFTFAGWATEANGGGTRFADGASYDFVADLTLYAQWISDSEPSLEGGVSDSEPSSGGGSRDSEPSSEEGAPPVAAPQLTLAATGSSQGSLLGLSSLALIMGLILAVAGRQLRRN